jgi:hypothetical protein
MALAIGGLLLGAVLGICFKVLILIPIIILILTAISGAAVVFGVSTGATVLSIVLAAAALQLGYFFGSLARIAAAKISLDMRANRTERENSGRAHAPQSPR